MPAASVGPQPENAVPNPPGDAIPNPHGTENDDNWSRPDALEEADATYRLRTLKATPMEYDAVVDAFKDNQGATKSLTKVLKHWGKSEVYNDCKALLSIIAASKQFGEGEAFVPGSAEFALAKCMVAAHRTAHGGSGDDSCYCLPSLFLAGCRHKPGIITPRKGLQDLMCHHCNKCVRCQGLCKKVKKDLFLNLKRCTCRGTGLHGKWCH